MPGDKAGKVAVRDIQHVRRWRKDRARLEIVWRKARKEKFDDRPFFAAFPNCRDPSEQIVQYIELHRSILHNPSSTSLYLTATMLAEIVVGEDPRAEYDSSFELAREVVENCSMAGLSTGLLPSTVSAVGKPLKKMRNLYEAWR